MSQDGVLLVQGNAGVGKTYTMKAFKAAIGNQPIRGLAPSAAAADVLQTESGIPSQTLASYLLTSDERLPRPEILLVDEAGMLSSAQMEGLLEKAHKHHNRVLLVGDTKQLAAVEAGAPFKLLQTAGLPTALIDQNLRQRDPHLKQVVDLMATHEQNADSINRAYQHLDKQGKIRQIVAESERLQVLAADYLSRLEEVRAKTLILASTNADKSAIATTVRQGLIAQGILGDESLQIQILKRKALDPFALTQAHFYQRGDVIKFQTNSARFSQDLYYRISVVNPHTQTATLIDTAGQIHELPLNRYKQREVYRVQNLEIRPGEQMRFTKNLRTSNQKQLNGQRFTVEGFTPDGQITIQTGGKVQEVCPFQLLHSDYGYVDTVHSSQGRTADYCIYSAAPAKSLTIGRESFYVAASRARQEFVVYTASSHDLGVTVKQSRANENALDLVEAEQKKLPTKSPMSSQSVQKARDCPPAGQEPVNSLSSAPLPRYSSASAPPSLPSDAELLAQLQAVQQWQKRCPPSPQPSEGEKLKRKLNELTRRKTKLEQLEREQAIELERLGKPRSWFNPFGPSAERVEEQQEQLRDTRANLYPVARELASVKVMYQQWQQKARDYQAWQRAPQTQKMKELIEFLKSPPVQERFQLLQQVDEVHSAAQYILDWQGEQGKDCRYFQGKFYRIEEREETLTISHQERTEMLLEVADRREAGGILEISQFNLSETDREKLRAYAQALEQQVQRWQEGQNRESQELELGG